MRCFSTERRGLLATHFNRQTLATFIAAAGKNVATIFSGHAGTKPMSVLAAAATGLICAFHQKPLRKKLENDVPTKKIMGQIQVEILIYKEYLKTGTRI